MTDSGFEKVGESDKRLYGQRKLLLCGFPVAAQPKFITLLDMLGIAQPPLVWVSEPDRPIPVGDLFERPDASSGSDDSTLPRAIIVAGLEEQELHLLMSGCRQAGMKQALWAVLTPTSETWPLGRLLDELAAEHEAVSRNRP